MTLRTTLLLIVVTAVTAAKSETERKMTVDDLFQLVESNSKTLQTEKISVEFAKKGIEVARSARLPEFNVSANVSLNGDVVVTDRDFTNARGYAAPRWGNSLALEAQMVVYSGGAIDAGVSLSELGHQQATIGMKLTRQQQRLLALGQFLELLKLSNRKQVYEKNIQLTQQLISDIKAKLDQGMALQNDVTRYELQLEQLKLGLRKVVDMHSVLNFQLCNQLGLDPAGQVIRPVMDEVLEKGVDANTHLLEWQNEATANSPQLTSAGLQEKMASQELRLAKSELLPKVALVAADNFSGPFTYDLPPIDKNINYWYLGVGIRYPLSSIYKSRKKVQQAHLNEQRAVQAHSVASERLANEVQADWTHFQQTFVELDTQRKSVQLALQNYQVMNERYLSQLALVTDMIDASNIKFNAELEEVDAHINVIFAYYKLKYTAGTL